MKRFPFLIIICLTTISCDRDLNNYKAKFVVPLDVDNKKELSECIDSISIVPLEITDNWKYIVYPSIYASDKLFVVLDAHYYRLLVFNKSDFSLLFAKDIKGRGRGEIMTPGNTFILSQDTICIFDQSSGRISMYGTDGRFIDFLNKENEICADYVYPVRDYIVAVSQDGGNMYNRDYVSYYKRDGSLLRRQLTIPDMVYECGVYSGDGPSCFTYNDTLRFIMPFTYHLFSSTLNKLESTYLFDVDRAIPKDYFNKSDDMMISMGRIIKDEYVWNFHNIVETDNHIAFSFLEGQNKFKTLIDKRTNAVSTYAMTTSPEHELTSVVNIWRYVLATTNVIYADNDYLYAYIKPIQNEVLEASKVLDIRLETYSQSTRDYIEKYNEFIDNDTRIIVKIKLK
jgi:hypothetical protein